MNKRKKSLIMIAVLLSIFTVLAFQLKLHTKTVSREDVTSVKVDSEQIEAKVQLKSEVKEAKEFTSSIRIPFAEIEAIDVPIKQWVDEKENSFFDEMEQNSTLLGKKLDAHFSIDTEVIKVTDDLFSYVLTVEQLLDEDNKFTELKTYVVDLKEETISNMDDILELDAFSNDEVTTSLLKSMDNKILTEDEFQSFMEAPNELQFVLKKKKMELYLNSFDNQEDYQITKIAIQYKELEEFLTEHYKSIFIPKEVTESIPKEKVVENDGKKRIAITFDDGPHAEVTPQILQALKDYNAKATFFMLSSNVTSNPEVAKQVVAEGHEAANHSITHVNLNTVGNDRIKSEVIDSQNTIEQVTGVKPTLFRPPFGEFNQAVTNIANESNQAITMWSVDTLDWKYRNTNAIYENVINNTSDGSIILLHDIHQTTADALPSVLERLKADGFEFVTVSELLPYISPDGLGPHYGK